VECLISETPGLDSRLDVKLSDVGPPAIRLRPFVISADISKATELEIQTKLCPCPNTSNQGGAALPFNAGIKSLRATLPDEIFYWGFCFLNREFR
jgi:hypothetical protein